MNSIRNKSIKAVVLLYIFLILSGCNHTGHNNKAVAQGPSQKAAWLAYWDVDEGEKDLNRAGDGFKKLSFFAAYFNHNNQLFIPQELADKRSQLKKKLKKYESYLTFVNDREKADDRKVMKDIVVLREKFANNTAMEKHIEEIVALTLAGGYDGIELDYERVWKDEELGQAFLQFIHKLYVRAGEHHLKLRVVLEPSAPVSDSGFSEGPEYVMMLYNLYGLHSDPGPKANKEFIQRTAAKLQFLPGTHSVAFSTGGCMWGSDGKKRFLTEVEARTLAVQQEVSASRDEESQCMVFQYQEKGISYQVWYADVTTLNYWMAVAKEEGEDSFSFWRLGGNVDINRIE